MSTLPPPTSPRATVFDPALKVTVLADNIMRPPFLTNIVSLALALKVPLCLITPPTKVLMARADKIIKPPGALTAVLFSIKASIALGVAVILAR